MTNRYDKNETDKHDLEYIEEEAKKKKELEERNRRLNEMSDFINRAIEEVEVESKTRKFVRYNPNEVEVHTDKYEDYVQLRTSTTNGFIDDKFNVDVIRSTDINPEVLIKAKRIKLVPDLNEIILANPFDELYLQRYFNDKNYKEKLKKVHQRLVLDVKVRAGVRGYKNAYINAIIYRIHEEYKTFNILIEWAFVRRVDELDNKSYRFSSSDNVFRNYKVFINPEEQLKNIQLFDINQKIFVLNNNMLTKFVIEHIDDDTSNYLFNINIELLNTEYRKVVSGEYQEDSRWIEKIKFVTVNNDEITFDVYKKPEESDKKKRKTDSKYTNLFLTCQLIGCCLAYNECTN